MRLTTDTGLTGVGEASLEWQERAVESLLHEWVEERVLGADPFDVEAVVGGMIRDQYQGGLDGADGDQRRRDRLLGPDRQGVRPAGLQAARRPRPRAAAGLRQRLVRRRPHAADYAARAREVVARGYRAMKFDPFGVAWKEMTPRRRWTEAEQIVAAVREAVGDRRRS